MQMGSVLQDRTPKTRVIHADGSKVVALSIVSTLQDLGYQIEYTSSELRLITGHGKDGKVTVTYNEINKDLVQVRANFSNLDDDISTENLKYQSFFNVLSKNVFLSGHGII